ncbi:hypothetical protein GCM10022380_39290 [Amycolatopsis tucumanensis]|uniref:Alpha/beta hydrolase fold-3 domain-containing protein n=1 Tax=Amycolatopsis tucumanensis TaxID=401106 RepID=A0ABP7IFH5_9PSEU
MYLHGGGFSSGRAASPSPATRRAPISAPAVAAERLAARLEDVSTEHVLTTVDGLPHAFLTASRCHPSVPAVIHEMIDFLVDRV